MESETILGKLSGRKIFIPDVNFPALPVIAPPGVIQNGTPVKGFERIGKPLELKAKHAFQRRFGLLIPATNTVMEHDLWRILFANQTENGLCGVSLVTSRVLTPKPDVGTPEALENFKRQFLGGVESATKTVLLGHPQYLMMGLSLEHILTGLSPIRESMEKIEGCSALSWATWHDAVQAALRPYQAKRIGILTPWDQRANTSGVRMFEDLGFEVVANVGFSCTNVLSYTLIPDWAKEKAVLELLATKANKLDAVVQCGTNLSMLNVIDKLEDKIGIPILGINATILWYALRENGFTGPVSGAGRLLREF